jgi:hypothetical protein
MGRNRHVCFFVSITFLFSFVGVIVFVGITVLFFFVGIVVFVDITVLSISQFCRYRSFFCRYHGSILFFVGTAVMFFFLSASRFYWDGKNLQQGKCLKLLLF